MDTRRALAIGKSSDDVSGLGTDAVPMYPAAVTQVRYVVTSRGAQGLQAIVSTFVLIVVLTVIVGLAIASSTGWSVLDAWSG